MRNSHVLSVLVVGLIAASCWLLTPSHAEPAASGPRCNIGLVNIPNLFRDSKEFKSRTTDFEKRTAEIKAETETQQKALSDREEELGKKFTPDSKDYRDRMRELMTDRIKLRVTLEEQRNNFMLEYQRFGEAFYAKIVKAVEDAARDEGLDMVMYHEAFPTRAPQSADELLATIRQRRVLYNSSRADITDKVLVRLDANAAIEKTN